MIEYIVNYLYGFTSFSEYIREKSKEGYELVQFTQDGDRYTVVMSRLKCI